MLALYKAQFTKCSYISYNILLCICPVESIDKRVIIFKVLSYLCIIKNLETKTNFQAIYLI